MIGFVEVVFETMVLINEVLSHLLHGDGIAMGGERWRERHV